MNIYRVNMTQAEYNAYIAVPTNTVPNNYQIFITDAPAGTPNLYTGTGTNTPTSGTSGGGTGGFNNFTATTAPTATDDSGDGYTIGSRWIDTTNDESYICVDATLGSAVWSKTTVGIISEVAGLQGALDAKLDDTDIVNDLTTGGTTKVLSAEQGKNLETNKEPKVTGKGLSTNDYTTTEKNKLAGVATGATANDTDANLKSRTNHTGTQAQSTVDNLTTDLAGKSATTHTHTGTYEPADATILKEAEIVNTLVGTDTNKPLSAAQGKALQDGKRELYSLGHPYHTAATQAGHIVTASSEFSADYAGWKALQASPVGLSEWATANASSASLTYQLPQATVFNRVVLMGRLSGIEYPTIWSIEGSNDGTTYTTLVASHVESLQAEVTKDFTNTTAYKYYRFSYTAVVGTNSGLNHIRYYHTGINYLPTLPINNTLTSTSITEALSAAQGKVLQDGKYPIIVAGTIDANSSALQDNTIYIGNNTGAATNTPGGWAWSLFNFRMGTWRHQIFQTASSPMYYRSIDGTFTTNVWTKIAEISDLATYAPLASPTLTGTPAAPTATAGTNTTQLATTAFINTALTGGNVSAYFDELRFDNVRAISNTDLNTLNISGFYDGINLTNAPGASTGWFYIEHLRHSNFADPNWRMQKAYGLGSPNSGLGAAGTMYIRTMVSGVWQAWRTVTTTLT